MTPQEFRVKYRAYSASRDEAIEEAKLIVAAENMHVSAVQLDGELYTILLAQDVIPTVGFGIIQMKS